MDDATKKAVKAAAEKFDFKKKAKKVRPLTEKDIQELNAFFERDVLPDVERAVKTAQRDLDFEKLKNLLGYFVYLTPEDWSRPECQPVIAAISAEAEKICKKYLTPEDTQMLIDSVREKIARKHAGIDEERAIN